MNERKKLMETIYQLGFVIDETVLYLDTHPTDESALEYYNIMKKAYKKACHEYTIKFGPLDGKNVENNAEKWIWIKNPWPWELEGC